jgi:hypothetical protein
MMLLIFLLCSWWCKVDHKNELFFQCLAAQYTVKESDSPTLYFACNIVGHCLQGQKVAINVPSVRSPASFLFSPLYPLRNSLLFPSHMIRCVGCYSVRFSCSLNFYWSFTQPNLCCISKSTMKHQRKLVWKLDLRWFSYGYCKCMFVDSLTEFIRPPIVFNIQCGVVNKMWWCSLISLKYVSLWCCFLILI